MASAWGEHRVAFGLSGVSLWDFFCSCSFASCDPARCPALNMFASSACRSQPHDKRLSASPKRMVSPCRAGQGKRAQHTLKWLETGAAKKYEAKQSAPVVPQSKNQTRGFHFEKTKGLQRQGSSTRLRTKFRDSESLHLPRRT